MGKQETKTESEESNRMWASASFVGVLIIIGLPLWWKTTEVYRVSLPYDKISEFSSLPNTIGTELTVVAKDEATAAEVASVIQKAFKDEEIIKLTIKKTILADDVNRALDSAASDEDAVKALSATFDLEQHNTFYVVERRSLSQDVWLGMERVMFFKDLQASATLATALKQWVYQPGVLAGAVSVSADEARRTRVPPGAAYHVALAVVHPRPDRLRVSLDAQAAVEDYIGSFVDELSELHNFTLKSQWIYLLDFDFKAKEVKDDSEWGRHFAVPQSRLQQLLARLEARGAAHVSPRPALALALYLAPCDHAPLVIYDEADKPVKSPVQAFMTPKWGGVVLASPGVQDCAATPPAWTPDVNIIMGTFLAQLRKLLGINDVPPVKGAYLQPLRSVRPRRWEVDALLRVRTLEQLASATRTLHSLSQLLGEISNIVINDEVGLSINSAVEHISGARALAASAPLLPAYRAALHAHARAEAAFMDPALLALLYFPDDQKYAIYIPLFLPIMFPVVLSLKNLFLWFRGKPVHKDKAD